MDIRIHQPGLYRSWKLIIVAVSANSTFVIRIVEVVLPTHAGRENVRAFRAVAFGEAQHSTAKSSHAHNVVLCVVFISVFIV